MDHMDQDTIIHYITETFEGVEVLRPADGPGAGDSFFYYDPQQSRDYTHRLPFATVVTKDYDGFDTTSQLHRPGVFRLNIGVGRDVFRALLGYPPSEASEKSADTDFAALDRLMPHPIYGTQSWVCVLNPSPETFDAVKPLLADAYSRDVTRFTSKQSTSE